MIDTAKFDLINRACAQVSVAKRRAWNNFCALNDNPLHKQHEVLFLGLDLDTLHDIRRILRKHPEGNEEALALLEWLRDTVFRNITNCIHAITQASEEHAASLDVQTRTSIKHDVEGELVNAARYIREALKVFDIDDVTASQL